MCFQNYTQHNGCGHVGESHTHPWTLCPAAIQRLNDIRGPSSPPILFPTSSFSPPKRSASSRRFFSLSGAFSRSTSTASSNSRRTVSGPSGKATSRSSSTSRYDSQPTPTAELDYSTLPDHQLVAVRCADPTKRTHVSREMNVCKCCTKGIDDMRSMIARYDKTGSIRGTIAFERFLKCEGEGAGDREGDLTVPVGGEGTSGPAFGARQAIVMGFPESAMNANGPRGLGTLERDGDESYFKGRREKYEY